MIPEQLEVRGLWRQTKEPGGVAPWLTYEAIRRQGSLCHSEGFNLSFK